MSTFNFDALGRINLPAIFENTSDSVWAINTNYEILYTNTNFKSAFYTNFRIELVPGTNLLLSLPKPIRDLWKSRYNRGLNNESFSFIDEVITDKTVYIEVFVNPIIVDEKVVGVLFFAKDITQRREDIISLKNSELLLKASLESQQNTILFSINKEFEYLFFNKAHYKSMQFAYHKNIEIGKNILEYINSDKERKIVKDNFERALKGESHSNIRIHGEKNKAYYESFFNPIRNENGEIIGVTGLARNITKRKEAENTIRKRENELKKLNETKDKLFSIIGHDLRGPAINIVSFSTLLLNKLDDISLIDKEKYIQSIKASAESNLKLLDNLLEWAKSQTGITKIDLKEIILIDLVKEVIKLKGSLLEKKNISLSVSISETIIIYADKNLIKTVLRNLISNAIKFSKHNGEIKIKAEKNENNVQITVSDSGIGMSEKKQKNLFDISNNKSTVGTDNEKGTGLGLILCKDFIEKHNGCIWVESTLGEGSSFKFTLPNH